MILLNLTDALLILMTALFLLFEILSMAMIVEAILVKIAVSLSGSSEIEQKP